MRRYWVVIGCAALAVCSVSAEEPVLDSVASHTGATRILIRANGPDGALSDGFTDGVPSIPSLGSRSATAGGRLAWRVIRDFVDNNGFRHVFYEQVYQPSTAVVSAGVLPAAGVPLAGGAVGFHYLPDGTLFGVAGGLYEDVAAVGALAVQDVTAARSLGEWAITNTGTTPIVADALLDEDVVGALAGETTLRLVSRGDGRTFSFVWDVPLLSTTGNSVVATIDAATADLVKEWDPNPFGCDPQSDQWDFAQAIPQNTSLTMRTNTNVRATDADDLGPAYSHEGHRPPGGALDVDIQVFDGVDSPDGCEPLKLWGTKRYARLPVRSYGSTPRYEDEYDGGDLVVPGRSGGDALWKTFLTMQEFDALGWDSYDGNGSDAKIVVHSGCGGYKDNARFLDEPSPLGPLGSVVVCEKDARPFEESASLDVIAHEWGHGVAFAAVGWPMSTDVGASLNEGWADVIAYHVEWAREPSGSGVEKADWHFDEDNNGGTGTRFVDADDGAGGYSFHDEDPPQVSIYGHYRGNRLPVALRLASVGGENPVCSRLSGLSYCGSGVSSIGVHEAGPVFFSVLTNYATSSHSWEDFADLAALAAFEKFSYSDPPNCYDGELEQASMLEAFAAIGYPGTGFVCVCEPDCGISEW